MEAIQSESEGIEDGFVCGLEHDFLVELSEAVLFVRHTGMGPQRKKQIADKIASALGPLAQVISTETVLVRVELDLIEVEIELVWLGDGWGPLSTVRMKVVERFGPEMALSMSLALMEGSKLALQGETEIWMWLAKGL